MKHLDKTVLDTLASIDESLVKQVLEMYEQTSPALFEALIGAAKSREAKTVVGKAHALKSASANIGALEFASVCQKIETAAKTEDWPATEEAVLQLQEVFPQIMIEIRASSN